jgi:ribose 5-phosphate isomerase B
LIKTIFTGSDHGGLELKNAVFNYLKQSHMNCVDCGTYSNDSVNYPDIAKIVCEKVLSTKDSVGILICGTGIGISIAANKIKNIRAALCSETYSATMARVHNNANILCFGGRVIGDELAKSIVDSFINGEFEGGRHQIRLDLITELENS